MITFAALTVALSLVVVLVFIVLTLVVIQQTKADGSSYRRPIPVRYSSRDIRPEAPDAYKQWRQIIDTPLPPETE